MMNVDDLELAVKKARDFAALAAEFDPMAAVKSVFADSAYSPPLAARVMAVLRADCVDAGEGKLWIMRQSPRDRILSQMRDGGQLDALSKAQPTSEVAFTMPAAVFADSETMMDRIDTIMALRDQNLDDLSAMAKAVELAGRTNREIHQRLPALLSKLNRERAVRQSEQQLEQGYYGNEALRNSLAAWIDQPPDDSFARTIYVSGTPGVGKSFLLTKIKQEARDRSNPIELTLDFDRRILNVVESETLAMELSRQLGNALPDLAAEQFKMRVRMSGEHAREGTKRRGTTPYAVIEAMGAAVRASGRKVLLILDTLEVLASHGVSHPARLFDFLDDVIMAGVRPIAIIAAGRGEALQSLGKKRLHRNETLSGLPKRVARLMLGKLNTPRDAIDPILNLARGNPLLLRLAAKLVRSNGQSALDSSKIEGKDTEVISAYLYRAILSRIDDQRLARIASLGLILARVNAKAIQMVIGPVCNLTLSDAEADAMLSDLATHHWLVETEVNSSWLRHRSDLRQIILRIVSKDQSAEVAAIHAAAATFFEDLDAVEACYHRLHLLTDSVPTPKIDPTVAAQFTSMMIDELPIRAADAVRLARGERSKSFSEPYTSGGVAEQPAASTKHNEQQLTATLLADLRMMLESGDLIEAQSLFNAYVHDIVDPQSPAGIATLCYFWISGQWRKAERLYRMLEAAEFVHHPWEGADVMVQLVILEMRAEFGFDALVHEFEHDEHSLRRAQLTYRDGKAMRLFEGALAFALLAEQRPNTISGGWRDAVGVSGTGLQDQSIDSYGVSSVTAVREQFGLSLNVDQAPIWEIVTAMNPYTGPVSSLLTIQRKPLLSNYVMELGRSISAMQHFPFTLNHDVPTGERMLNKSAEVVSYLGALGMTADWLSAFTFFYQVSDAPLLARRAETWRRTAAGEWVYGATPPSDWATPSNQIDRGAMLWLERILERLDALDESARQLLFWLRPHHDQEQRQAGRVPIGARAEARLLRTLQSARRAAKDAQDDPAQAALLMLKTYGIGRAIAVPIAIIASQSRVRLSQNQWLEQLASSGSGALRGIIEGG